MSFPNFYESNNKFQSLLTDYFNVGNLTAKIISNKSINLEIAIDHCCKSRNLELDVQSKITLDKYHIDLIKRFSSSNVLTMECCVNDLFFKNSGHYFSMTNDFSVGHRQALMKNFKSTDNFHGGIDFKFISDKPIVTGHGLFGYENYFSGGKLSVDTHKKNINVSEMDFCVGYSVPDFTFHGLVSHNKSTLYEASLYSRISESLELGVQFQWERKSKDDKKLIDVNVFLCGHVSLNKEINSFVKFKTANYRSITLAYGFDFMKGIQLALSGELSKNDMAFGISTTVETD